MSKGACVFSQVLGLVVRIWLQTIVNQHLGDYKDRDINGWKQHLHMAFGQLTHRKMMSADVL